MNIFATGKPYLAPLAVDEHISETNPRNKIVRHFQEIDGLADDCATFCLLCEVIAKWRFQKVSLRYKIRTKA